MDSGLHQSLNEHLSLEFEAFHRYHALAIWFDLNDLPGFASWMRQQSNDELGHAKRIIDHLLERDLTVALPKLAKPPTEWASAQEAVESVMASEKAVTASINKLYSLADKSSDRPATIMLQWFVNEQVEEENVVRALLGRLKLAGSSGVGLLLVDQELAGGVVAGAATGPEA
ncbi:MAG TPA: ferritin [Thermoanaerobaculia bacterium]|nr:ferritin [Thermoanaerobaculia bacterium]